MPLLRRSHLGIALACAVLLAACTSPALPPGGLTDSTTASTADTVVTVVPVDNGPGFLTPTPPQGGGGDEITPPPGGLQATDTPVATPVRPATPRPSATASRRATGSPSAGPPASPTATPYQTATAQATDTPVPVATAARGASIQVSMPTPAGVSPGGTATIQAGTTVPGAVCTLTVRYRTGGSEVPQFPVETADASGAITWSWKVAPDVVAGDWPVTVRCQVGLPLGDADLPFAYANNLLSVQ